MNDWNHETTHERWIPMNGEVAKRLWQAARKIVVQNQTCILITLTKIG